MVILSNCRSPPAEGVSARAARRAAIRNAASAASGAATQYVAGDRWKLNRTCGADRSAVAGMDWLAEGVPVEAWSWMREAGASDALAWALVTPGSAG
jgi:hypothetical protein